MMENYDAHGLEIKLREILKKSGIIHEISEINLREPEELKGEHMATVTIYASIKFKNSNVRERNLFIKLYSSHPTYAVLPKRAKVMEKESSFFNCFLPSARKFCENYPNCENLLKCFPRFVYGDDEIIIFDNMVVEDFYEMLPKKDYQDLHTAKIVLTNLAKFHAVSFCMAKTTGFNEFKKQWELNLFESFDININPMIGDMIDNTLRTCINLLKKYPKNGSEIAEKLFESYVGKVGGEITKILNSQDPNSIIALNHGDCWNNNMLFKINQETGKVTEHIFVDLQITRFGSPNLDIGYYLYYSVKPAIRRAHLKELLELYYITFTNTSQLVSIKTPISFEQFYEDYKRNSKLGFVFSLILLTGMGALNEIDIDSMPANIENSMDYFNNETNKWIQNNPEEAKLIVDKLIAVVDEFLSVQSSTIENI